MFSTAEKSCITIAFGEAEGEIAAVVSRGWGTSTKKKKKKEKKEGKKKIDKTLICSELIEREVQTREGSLNIVLIS